jgi:hypothetical protein
MSLYEESDSLYKESDSLTLIEKVDEIMKEADNISSKKIKPTSDELWEIIFTVCKFVKEKQRKIYGGFALNKLIEEVAPKDKFYSDDDIKSWDIDFYSPDPMGDAKEISNRLHEKGFRYIQAREAQHEETYKIFAETNECADISYVPRNIYNKMPFKIVNGFCLTGPHYMMIDYFRVLTDPLTSYFRLEKTFTRLCLMLKHYPLPKNTTKINTEPPGRDFDVAFHTVHDFLKDRESTIVIGMYAFNHLIKESKINERDKNLKRGSKPGNNKRDTTTNGIDYVDINYYEIISTQYTRDARNLILALQDKFITAKDRITYSESYPFFQYLGYSVDVYLDDEIICKIYNYNSKCTPYINVPALYFKKSGYDEEKGIIQIGSFASQMLYNLINIMKARTDNNPNKKNLHYTMISHITDMKNYYFNQTKKTIFDKSLFQEFILTCTGDTNTPHMERAIRVAKKIKDGKKISWVYNPENQRDRNNDSKYVFKNSSGNPISNNKNMRINLTNTNNENTDDIDEAHDPEADLKDNLLN